MARGGFREGAGRKVGTTKDPALCRNERIVLSCTKEQKDAILAKAKEANMNVTQYLIKLALGE
ncbi:MAG: hypothetical protein SPJ62_01125 [Inconstantimicrobium porci]|uniref:plasmid mobilization protein n=1 Tax=Inconstantimicrobium porci TaxID=2652291 RepID=UPI002A91C893|nr:hypothetical protein [Inconstantimicrobium porci]MDY5910621.1 hypothetical protein [Inconstantimicrobium porci]